MHIRGSHVVTGMVFVAAIMVLVAPMNSWAQVTTYTVGPNGSYPTVGAALTALLAAPTASNWIKVQAGVSTIEHLYFPASWVSGTIWLSGGWNASFTSQSGNPADTVLDGNDMAPAIVTVAMAGGTLIVSDLTILEGWSDAGGGISIQATGGCSVWLDNLVITANSAVSASASASGGGVSASLHDSSSLTMLDCDVHQNGIFALTSGVGGGVYISADGAAEVTLKGTRISDNLVSVDTQVTGGALYMSLDDNASATIEDCLLEGNRTSSSLQLSVDGAALQATLLGDSVLKVERSRFLENNPTFAGAHEQVEIMTFGGNTATIRDTIIAGGASNGLFVRADGQSTANLMNLTVAGQEGDGIVVNRVTSSTAAVSLSNSIAYGNSGSNLVIAFGPLSQTANLIGIDPEFVDLANLDLRFQAGSIAEDAGIASPPGGLGVADVRGGIRVLGLAPDAGAYEGDVSLLFSDGFDLDGTGRWSVTVGGAIF